MSVYDHKKVIGKTFLSLLENEIKVDIPVYGLSMFPFYLPGDLVRVEAVNNTNLKVGNVVVFIRNNRLVAHRLIKIDPHLNKVVTKGDGLKKKDANLLISDIKGVVIMHLRHGKEVKFINNHFFKRLIVLMTPFMGYINNQLSRIWYKLFYK